MADKKVSELTEVTEPTSTDVVPILNASELKKATLQNLVEHSGASLVDTTAIHKATASEISAFTEKVTPHDDDVLVLEDSESAFAKKKVKISSISSGAGGGGVPSGSNVIHLSSGRASSGIGLSGWAVWSQVHGQQLIHAPATWKFSVEVNTATLAISWIHVLKAALGSVAGNTILGRTVVTIGGVAAPSLTVGVHTTDVINLQLDPAFDWWIAMKTASSSGILMKKTVLMVEDSNAHNFGSLSETATLLPTPNGGSHGNFIMSMLST